jgi:hypothetical protein
VIPFGVPDGAPVSLRNTAIGFFSFGFLPAYKMLWISVRTRIHCGQTHPAIRMASRHQGIMEVDAALLLDDNSKLEVRKKWIV